MGVLIIFMGSNIGTLIEIQVIFALEMGNALSLSHKYTQIYTIYMIQHMIYIYSCVYNEYTYKYVPTYMHICTHKYVWCIYTNTYKCIYISIQAGFPGGSETRNLPADVRDMASVPDWEDPLEKEMTNCSSILVLRNSMDRAAWQVTVHGLAKSQTWQRLNNNKYT